MEPVILSEKPLIRAFNMDCMDLMRKKPDGFYSLAICDPPYAVNLSGGRSEKDGWNPNINWEKCNKGWNLIIPKQEYFIELQRVSSDQIIWGGNYFANMLPNSQCWIVWDKGQRNFSLADGEMAWGSFDKAMRIYSLSRARAKQEIKIHPTQKPVALYLWLLTNYAKPGQTIFDSHGGSFSSAIACHKMGYNLDICEIDKEYFDEACSRFERETRQFKLFGGGIK